MKRGALPLLLLWSACLFGQASSAAGNRAGVWPCSLLNRSPNTRQAVSAEDLFQAYSTQAHLIRSLHMIGSMKGTAGTEYGTGSEPLELAVIVDLVQPNLIRITGVVPYQGSRVVELTSDGHQFGLLIPEGGKKVFLTGPIDAPPQSKNVRENLRPRPFIEALRWEEGTMRATTGTGPANASDTRTLTVDVVPTENTPTRKVDVVFDLTKGVVNTLTAYDNTGAPTFRASYGDWKTETDPSSGVAAECFARHIVLVELQQDYQVDIRISDLNLNPPIPKSYFRPSPPHGVPIKHLDMASGRSNQ
jgi:outer membrane lipoprotein-sorting protein